MTVLPAALGLPKGDWGGLLTRAVDALERIATSFEETEPIPEQTAPNPDYEQLLRRQIVATAKTIQLHSTSLTSILDDEQDAFRKAKRLREHAKAVLAYGEHLESEYGEGK